MSSRDQFTVNTGKEPHIYLYKNKRHFGFDSISLTFIFFSLIPLQNLYSDQAAQPMEYQLKAVFLFNFAKFVEWPPESFADDNSELVISILGKDPFGPFLDETVEGESIRHHPIIIKRIKKIEELGVSHILFVSSSEMSNLSSILSNLQNQPVLTVGDMPEFAKNGGMVRFMMVDNKVKIRINLDSAESQRLHLNSRLLSISEIITTKENQP